MYAFLKRTLWAIFLGGIGTFGLWLVAVSQDWGGYFGGMPDLSKLENPKSELASELWSSDGELLGKYFRENRTPVKYDELSPNLLNALYATEDIRFEDHSGIDLKGNLSIAYYLLQGKRRGASTITQQLAKVLFSTRKELVGSWGNGGVLGTLIVKTKEWILAVQLERSYTKKEIVTMYLNEVELGSNAYGIKSAAKTYFNTTPGKLTIPQAAMLVGMLKSPTRYHPILREDNALFRRNVVLDQMVSYQYLSQAEAQTLRKTPIGAKDEYNVEGHNTGVATYFRTVMRNWLVEWCAKNGHDLFSDGLKIYTTVDSRMQRYAEEAVQAHIRELQGKFFAHWRGRNPWVDESNREISNFLERAVRESDHYKALRDMYGDDSLSIYRVLRQPVKMRVFTWDNDKLEKDTTLSPMDSVRYYLHFLQSGLMSMNPHSGEIKAWVGGINHKYFKYDHVRQGARQPGSAFKPIVYATAVAERKFSPCFMVDDVPRTFTLSGGRTWTAKNFGGYSYRSYPLRTALALSLNTAAAYLMQEMRPEIVIDYARQFGISTPLEAVPSLALGGGGDVSVFDLTGAYAAIANKGRWIEPVFITEIKDKAGKTLYRHIPKQREVLSEEDAYIMTYMMRGATEVQGGTANGLWKYNFRQGNQIACKTGTTQNYSDGWFMGFTKDLVAGVWVGADKRSIHFRDGSYGQGSRMAMPAFAMFMEKVYADSTLGYTKGEFPKPQGELGIELDCSKYHQARPANDSATYVMPTGNPLKN
jgi:penicillin-binding protein 1A